MTATDAKTALIIGASRGLGYALAAEYLARGWQVTATVRGSRRTGLHELASSSDGRLVVETVDITVPEQVAVLHGRLAQTRFGLQDLVAPDGTIGVMSSGQGSVANNDKGGFEIYRASKSALNQLMRSFAARHAGEPRTLLLMAPGWVQTGLGGPAAPLTIGQSIPGVVDTIEAQAGQGGLQYLDYQGHTVRW